MNRSFGGSLDCNSVNYNKGKSFRFSEWNSSTLYSNDDYVQDFVSYMGSMYACIQTNIAVEPTNELYWKLVVSGQQGIQGEQGNTGVTFTPHVDADGNLSWTNNGGLENPQTVNIKGPKGADSTVPGPKGDKGDTGIGLTGPQGRTGEMGIGLEFNWDGTKLGIKRTVDDEYTYVDLKGTTGSRGLRGLTGNTGPEGPQGPKGDSLYIQVSKPNEFGQRFLQKRYSESEEWVSFFDLSQMRGPKGDSIIVERNLETGNIEYRYQNQPSSANKILIYKDDIKGPKGDTIAKTYVADDGYLYIQLSGEDLPRRVGYVRGDRGVDGREVVLRVYSGPSEDPNDPRIGTHLQWKYAGDEYKLWTNLIQINELMNIALAGLKLEYNIVSETDETGITTKYEVIDLSHYQVEFDENNNLVLTKKIANLSSVKVPTKTLLRDVKYNYDNNKLIFVFDTATGDETIEIDCDPFIRQGNGITISNGNIINVNVADESEKLANESDILVVDELGLRVRGIKDKLIKEFNLIKNDRDNNTHYYSYEYVAQDGTVYPIEIPDFVEWNNTDQTRQIELRNNNKLVGLDTDATIRNLINIDGTNAVQVGDSNVSINLNGKEANPTYNQQKLALKSEIPTKVSQLENDSNFLTSVPEEYVTDTELQDAISGVQFKLPVATALVLGGIKVGAGLSITEDGILSATGGGGGGGVVDSVNWENVIGRPTNLSQFTNDSRFITSDDLPDLSNYALKSEIPTNVSAFTNDSGYITSSALSDYAKKSEIPNISGLATKSELSGYALVDHTHVIADITDFPDISNLATKTELAAKQDALVSGTNIKTINGTSLLGSGNIVIEASGGGSGIIDVLDDKTYARTQGSWVDLTDWLTWAEL